VPKVVDHDQYRQTLLEQAFTLFAERGYATITMRDVATSLQVSTGTLYHYFPNKQAMFKSLMDYLVERDELAVLSQSQQRQHNQNQQGQHGQQQTLEVLLQYIEQNEAYFRQQIQLMVDYRQVHGQHTPELAAVALKYRRSVEQLTGLGEGEVTLLLSQILGLVLLRMVEGQPQGLEQQSFVQQSAALLHWLSSQGIEHAN
jgi:AcrR family transcriptional regulator